MPQLDPTWYASQIFWLAVTFLVLYVIISRIVLPPLLGIIGTREAQINNDIATSDQATNAAEEAKANYEKALADARHDSRKVIDDAITAHQQKADAAIADMQTKIQHKLDEAEKSIASRREQLTKDLNESSKELAELIATKLVGNA